MRHSYNSEGRCVHCDLRWHQSVGTACYAWKEKGDGADHP